jgi:hypothetical protein
MQDARINEDNRMMEIGEWEIARDSRGSERSGERGRVAQGASRRLTRSAILVTSSSDAMVDGRVVFEKESRFRRVTQYTSVAEGEQ